MGPGFGIRSDWGHPSLDIFSFGFHYHDSDDTSGCMFRFGFSFGLFGFHLDLGIFKDDGLWE